MSIRDRIDRLERGYSRTIGALLSTLSDSELEYIGRGEDPAHVCRLTATVAAALEWSKRQSVKQLMTVDLDLENLTDEDLDRLIAGEPPMLVCPWLCHQAGGHSGAR